jgi:hypothetical protein
MSPQADYLHAVLKVLEGGIMRKEGTETVLADKLDVLCKVLASMFVHSMGELAVPAKATLLDKCGFSNSEVASLLGKTEGAIEVALHRARKGGRRKSKARKS